MPANWSGAGPGSGRACPYEARPSWGTAWTWCRAQSLKFFIGCTQTGSKVYCRGAAEHEHRHYLIILWLECLNCQFITLHRHQSVNPPIQDQNLAKSDYLPFLFYLWHWGLRGLAKLTWYSSICILSVHQFEFNPRGSPHVLKICCSVCTNTEKPNI